MSKSIRMLDGENTMTVESWPTGVKGLSIVPFVWADETIQSGWYRLNHDASGLAFPYGWPSRAAVKRCAQAVADLVDWTQPFDDLREHSAVEALKQAGRKEGVVDWDLWWRIHPEEDE